VKIVLALKLKQLLIFLLNIGITIVQYTKKNIMQTINQIIYIYLHGYKKKNWIVLFITEWYDVGT